MENVEVDGKQYIKQHLNKDPKRLQNTVSEPYRLSSGKPSKLSINESDDCKKSSTTRPQQYHVITNPVTNYDGPDDLPDVDLFEKDYIQFVRERPYKSTAKRWLIDGAGIGGVLLLPFGPVGLPVGIILGLVIGLCSGLLIDLVKLKNMQSEAEKQKTKIKHLMRWAEFHFFSSEDQLQLLFKVIVEYQALAAMGAFSPTARAHLRMLYSFLKRDDVQHVLWTYVNYFLINWQRMGLEEISTVFEVTIQCCVHLECKRPPVVKVMEDLLQSSPALRRLFSQADSLQRKQRERAVLSNDWLMYADAGEMTAQEVFRRNMNDSGLRIRRLTGPTRGTLQGDAAVFSTEFPIMSQQNSTMDNKHSAVTIQLDNHWDPDMDDIILEREPEVTESIISANENEQLESLLQDFSIAPATGISEKPLALGHGILTPVPCHVTISRGIDKDSCMSTESDSNILKLPQQQGSPSHIISQSNELIDTLSPREISHDEKYMSPSRSLKKNRKGSKLITKISSTDQTQHEETGLPTIREKRLFKSLSDMSRFDEELKHQTPIGLYEFEFLTNFEHHDSKSKDWECTVNKPHCQVYKLKGESPVVLVKAFTTFDGLPCHIVSHFIRHIPTRKHWDKTFEDYRLIERDLENNEIIYCMMKAPWPIANRDFLQWRRTNVDDQGQVFIIMRSASHPDFPEKSGVVRAETIISGYIIRKVTDTSSTLFLLAQTDIRGLLPKFVVNQGAQRAPIQWADALKKACSDYVKKNGHTTPNYNSTIATV